MNFERGQDVKDSMSIGIKETLPELLKCYDDLVKYLNSYEPGPEIDVVTKQIWRSRPQRFVLECGWGNMNSIFHKSSSEEYAKMYTVIMKWHKKLL